MSDIGFIKDWVFLKKADGAVLKDNYCQTRDVFQSRLAHLLAETQNYLLVASIGEIGNNSFDHNLGNWRDIPGIIFLHDKQAKTVVIADRGQGIKATLSKVKPDIKDDQTAIKAALTEIISGRAPEQRGNGLKFVSNSVIKNNWDFYLQSGNGIAEIKEGKTNFVTIAETANGCLSVIRY